MLAVVQNETIHSSSTAFPIMAESGFSASTYPILITQNRATSDREAGRTRLQERKRVTAISVSD